IFAICGAGDQFIAPPVGCQQFLAAFDNPQNQFLLCAKAHGFTENYNHSRILHSRTASREIYPLVLDWIHHHT
ncbi:MAG: alpha/beta hydrolase, partial [Bacteroidota bacterium]